MLKDLYRAHEKNLEGNSREDVMIMTLGNKSENSKYALLYNMPCIWA